MKKLLVLMICLSLALAFAGCAANEGASGKVGNKPAGVNDVLESGMAAADATSAHGSAEGNATAKPSAAPDTGTDNEKESVDVDLTVLSSTLVYSEVYNMMVTPGDYIGKTVKMNGAFDYYHDEATGKYYFACIIKDATACCASGIEFELAGEYVFPDDFPEVGDDVCVIGVFDTYTEGEYTYCTLRNARML